MPTGLFDVLSLQGVTFPSSNISSAATVGFEEKDDRDTVFVHITDTTFDTDAYVSLVLNTGSVTVTAAQAKTLPGVTAGERIHVFCELYLDSIAGSRLGMLEVRFFDESGVLKGTVQQLSADAAQEWVPINQGMIVPTGATRMNFYLRAGCDFDDETVQVWMANLKITRD